MSINHEEWSVLTHQTFSTLNWIRATCRECGNYFFYKDYLDGAKLPRENCGREKCAKIPPHFKTLSRKNLPVTPAKILDKFRKFFGSEGFVNQSSMNIQHTLGDTDLIIAGVQIFDGVIHQNRSASPCSLCLSQPCVRMQYKEGVKLTDGISTAFVNLCTESLEVNFEQYLSEVNQWITFLSQLGMHTQDIVLLQRSREKDRGQGPFVLFELFFHYAGLEIGDASYAVMPTADERKVSISDCGFGFERIVWAINKSGEYYFWLMPFSSRAGKDYNDQVRTSTLLALCGVKPSNKGPGLQLRRFAKTLSEQENLGLEELFNYYFDYWSLFVEPATDKSQAWQVFTLELDRLYNLRVSNKLSCPPPKNETREQYFRRLVYTLGVDAEKLRNFDDSID